jgi:hypothetical protein
MDLMTPLRSAPENQHLHETGLPVSCNRRHHQLMRCVLSLAGTAIPSLSLARQAAIPNYPIAIVAGIREPAPLP